MILLERYRWAVPTPNACARWSIFATYEYLLGIVPCMSLRGRQGRQLLRARVVCNRYATQYRSVSFPGMSLRGCEAAVAIRSP